MKYLVTPPPALLALMLLGRVATLANANVSPGDTITKETISQAEPLLMPATHWMVERGMPIQVIETKRVGHLLHECAQPRGAVN